MLVGRVRWSAGLAVAPCCVFRAEPLEREKDAAAVTFQPYDKRSRPLCGLPAKGDAPRSLLPFFYMTDWSFVRSSLFPSQLYFRL